MGGETVMVRGFGDQAAMVKVWEADEAIVYVLAPEEYARHIAGTGELFPIGFRIGDVFEFEQQLFADLAAASGNHAALVGLWRRARPVRH